MSENFEPLVSKHADGVLRVPILGRKSKDNPLNQNESIAASIADAEKYLNDRYEGPVEIIRLGEQISGMIYDRATIRRVEDLIESGWADAVLVEDIGRLFRNPRDIHGFPQTCVDAGVRFIAVADRIDTSEDNWEVAVTIAATRHGFTVPDTKRRVRRSAQYSFAKGGNVQKIRFGYRKLSREEALSGAFGPPGLRIAKLSQWTDVIREMADRAIRGQSYVSIANWLNAIGIPTGPFVSRAKWNARLVADFLKNPILGGWRTFRTTLHQRLYRTGRYKRRRNPDGPDKAHYPELAHLDDELFNALTNAIAEREQRSRVVAGKEHPRFNVPREHSVFPCQHARCGICGGLMYAYDKGQLKCQNSFKGAADCWNHVQLDGDVARERILEWVLEKLEELPSFRERLVDAVWTALEELHSQGAQNEGAVEARIIALEKEAANLAKAIRLGGELEALVHELRKVNENLVAAKIERDDEHRRADSLKVFTSREDVSARLDAAIEKAAATSPEFSNLLREIMPTFEIVPVQAIDTGLVRPRAKVSLCIGADESNGTAPQSPTEICGVIDLFRPPLHIEYLDACLRAKLERPDATLKALAVELGINHMTVKRALDLARHLDSQGLESPYRELREPPERASRWRKRS